MEGIADLVLYCFCVGEQLLILQEKGKAGFEGIDMGKVFTIFIRRFIYTGYQGLIIGCSRLIEQLVGGRGIELVQLSL